MSTTSEHVISEASRPRGRSALADGALVLVSPILYPLALFVPIWIVVVPAWVIGIIMLWLSRAWSGGQKLIGTFLTGISLLAVMTITIDLVSVGIGAAVAITLAALFAIMSPGLVGVVYLLRTRRSWSRGG